MTDQDTSDICKFECDGKYLRKEIRLIRQQIKDKDAEIASIFSLLVERDKAIAEARDIIWYYYELDRCYYKEAGAWLESNK